jgi:GGDEF domain-containing protein
MNLRHQIASRTCARLDWVATNFAVLVREVKICAEGEQIALRLKCCFVDPFVFGKALIRGGGSIGILLYLDDGASRDALLNVVDVAMYAKKKGTKHPLPAVVAFRDRGVMRRAPPKL